MTKRAADLLASGDVDGLLAFHRATFGDLRAEGDGGEGSGGEGAAGDGAGAGAGGGGDKTFTQAELDAIVARKENEAKRSASQRVADELGVTVDEAKALIKAQKDAEAAQLTEAQKREQAAEAAEKKATERETAAAARERAATVRTALVVAGCTDKDDIADAESLVRIDGDVTDDSATDAVAKLKDRRPELFKGTVTVTPNGAPPPAPPGAAPGRSGGPSRMSEARERYRKDLQPAK